MTWSEPSARISRLGLNTTRGLILLDLVAHVHGCGICFTGIRERIDVPGDPHWKIWLSACPVAREARRLFRTQRET